MRRRSDTMKLELHLDTQQVPSFQRILARKGVPTLTIAHLPRIERVGERALLYELLEDGGAVEVSRLAPDFVWPRGGEGLALATQFVSRKPLVLVRRGEGFVIDASQAVGVAIRVDGETVDGAVTVDGERLRSGVVIELGGQVVLVLHRVVVDADAPATGKQFELHGLVGESDGLNAVREAIEKVARQPGPVLVRGETGTGKELVASAIHKAGPRSGAPYVAVNMAAIPSTLAASELFGHARGAFSGAHQASPGMFGRADGGTLFMDEIGDTPMDVQAALLRVMETGEVQQVGADRVRKVDVRLIAATDADLDAMVTDGRFRAPLRFRLTNHEINLPPLRERRDDIGRLLMYFVRLELEALGRGEELGDTTASGTSWIPAPLVARLARYGWPGNVRQLRNVARWLASADHRSRPIDAADPGLGSLLPNDRRAEVASGVWEQPTSPPSAMHRRDEGTSPGRSARTGAHRKRVASGASLDAEGLERLMVENDYKLGVVAEVLGMSRPALNDLVDAHPTLRRAQHLTASQIADARARCGSIDAMWRFLRVSEKSLKLRMSALGMLND